MTARRRGIAPADLELWARYLRHVTPMNGVQPVAPPPDVPVAQPPIIPAPAIAVRPSAVPKARSRPPVVIGAAPPGLDRATWGRFRAGRIAPERVLDLHGMTKAGAHVAVLAVIASAHAQGIRCVEIVTGHGKRGGGEGVLRREVPFWLNDTPLRALILAVCHPHAANEGSLRILLRRVRE